MKDLQTSANILMRHKIRDFYSNITHSVNITLLVEHVADVLDCQELVNDSESWLWEDAQEIAEQFDELVHVRC